LVCDSSGSKTSEGLFEADVNRRARPATAALVAFTDTHRPARLLSRTNPSRTGRVTTSEAYLATGLHPDGDDAVTQLASALSQAADAVEGPEEEEEGRLRKLADGVGGVSRDVLGGVLTSVITAAGRGMIG
jgi:hypothetical protein